MWPEPDLLPAVTGDELLSVIVINDFAAITGGAAKVALTEAAGLARRGHKVTLVAGHGQPDPELIKAGVTVRTTGQTTTLDNSNRLHAAAQGIWNRTSAALVRELAGEADRRATIVHVHGFTKVLSASVIRAAVDSGLATLATLHDYFVACPNGGFFNYPRGEICRLTPLSARCIATHCDARAYHQKLWRVGRSAVQRRFGAMPAGVGDFIAPSLFAADILEQFLPAETRLHVLPNPVPARQAPPVDVSASGAFVLVGRLAPDKGAVLFARAARQAQVPAVFVGAGEEADSIRRAYPEAELTGWLDADRVRSIVRAARAVVSPSLVYETQGLSALEAAAQGVAAIVSDVSAAREAVVDEVTGLWFRGGDGDDLAEKLTRLERDPELTSRLGAAAYERFWSQDWDLDTHLDRLERIYRTALRS